MSRAEFEEKEYEQLAGVELASRGTGRGSALLFPAGQVLEHVLGYDAAADPVEGSVVWRVLQVPRPPGVRLVATVWRPARRPLPSELPLHPVSLILQYKRPEYLHGGRATQWRLWRQPYFRFRRTADQHSVLTRVEARLQGEVIVRYAAPAFWRRSELDAAQYARQVLKRSGFVSPTDLGRHQVWTYIEPGIDGRANPAGREREFATLSQLFGAIAERSDIASSQAGHSLEPVTDSPLIDHLARLGAAVGDRQPGLRRAVAEWVQAVQLLLPGLSNAQLLALRGYATTASSLGRSAASWHFIATNNDADR